jgi:DNA-binding NtrC family response regulator
MSDHHAQTPTPFLVEDDRDTREFYELLLMSAGHRVVTVATAETTMM